MPLANRLKALLYFLFLFSGSAVYGQYGDQPILASDLLQIKQIGSVTLSPDGEKVAYTVNEIIGLNDEEGKYRYLTHIFLAPVDGSEEPRQLTRGEHSASQPDWHPSGNKLAFTRVIDGTAQIQVLRFDGGESIPYTDFEHGASTPKWSPDGKRILFSSRLSHSDLQKDSTLGERPVPDWSEERPGLPEDHVFNLEETDADPDGDLKQIRAWLNENKEDNSPRVMHRLNFLGETDLQPEMSYLHLYVMDDEPLAGPVPLTKSFYSFSGAEWMPDSRHIVFQGFADPDIHPDRVRNSELYIADTKDQTYRLLLNRDQHSIFNPTPSPDGNFVMFQSSDQTDRGYAQTEIGIFDLSESRFRIISGNFDRHLGNAKWSPDNRYVYATTATNGGFPIVRFNLSTGDMKSYTELHQGVRDYDVNSSSLVFVLTEVANPFELYASELNEFDPQRISNHNTDWLADKKVSFPEKSTLTREGYEIEYWVMKPANFTTGATYPLLTQMHGGPSVMWGPGEASMWHEFQLMSARGYGIVYSNPRGSAGYGRDFQHGNHKDWGPGPGGDVLATTEAASNLDWADADRQVITGGSYAGYLTAWIITQDHRFNAAVAQRGVYDLITFMGEANAWRLIPDRFGGYPWDEGTRDLLNSESPMSYVHQIHTPLLIIHGDNDQRVGISQSEILFKSLKILDRPAELVRYPGGAHDLSRSGDPRHRMDRLLRIYEFMERYN